MKGKGYCIELEVGGYSREYCIGNYTLKLLEYVGSSYNVRVEDLLRSLATPPSRYYLRVNTLNVSVEELVEYAAEKDNLILSRDEELSDAVYVRVRGPFRIKCWRTKGVVVADRFASERVLIGANLYRVGVLNTICSSRGDYTLIVDPLGTPVGAGFLVDKGSLFVDVVESVYRVPKILELKAFSEGLLFDQSYPSMIAVRALDPKPGDVIVDLTAAPGGKITYAHQLTGGKAVCVGIDHSKRKILKMLRNIDRINYTGVRVLKGDSRRASRILNVRPTKVIVDPPCTALGNRPRLELDVNEVEVRNVVRLQKSLLYEASRIVEPGGLILYSTCTITLSENEEVVEWAERRLGLQIVEPSVKAPLSKLTDKPVIRYQPGVHDQPGFFISILRKRR